MDIIAQLADLSRDRVLSSAGSVNDVELRKEITDAYAPPSTWPELRKQEHYLGRQLVHDIYEISDMEKVDVKPNGTPYLPGRNPISIAHSNGVTWAAASTSEQPIGIDLQWHDPKVKFDEITETLASEREFNLIPEEMNRVPLMFAFKSC